MKFNIVVYGCDNSGKTTLCNQIASYLKENEGLNAYVTHSIGPGNVISHANFMSDILQDKKDPYLEIQLLDRFPIIEEFVCGSILRNYDSFRNLPEAVLRYMGKIFLFVHCDPPYEVIENWGSREQMDGVKENAYKMYDLYKAVSENFHIEPRTLVYDYTKDDPRVLAKRISDVVWFFYSNKLSHWEDKNEHN